MDISTIALALGSSLSAGLNLYLTVLALGLLQRFDVLNLPESMQVLSHPWILIAAGVLFLIEFVADKVPYVDNTWDAIHSFIRIPAGAILAISAVGDLPTHWVWLVALLGGFVSFSAHGAKASTRLAVNSTPEPFSNWFLSVFEDILTLGIVWLATNYPYLAIIAALILLSFFIGILVLFFKFLKMLFRKRQPSKAVTPIES
jgi:hypothetical protein